MILKTVQFGSSYFGPKKLTCSQKNIFFARSFIFDNFDAVVFSDNWFESHCFGLKAN